MSNQSIYSALIRAGLTPEGACGLMGNFKAESAMRSNNVEDRSGITDEDYTIRVDNDPAYDFATDGGKHYGYGLAQWTLASRKRALLAFARSRGASIGDEAMQVQFCIKELQGSFNGVWTVLTTSHNLYECTAIVCKIYENPAVHNVNDRYGFAQAFLAEMKITAVQKPTEKEARPDPSVLVLQMVMSYNGYWGTPDGYKSDEFFAAYEQFGEDMKKC